VVLIYLPKVLKIFSCVHGPEYAHRNTHAQIFLKKNRKILIEIPFAVVTSLFH